MTGVLATKPWVSNLIAVNIFGSEIIDRGGFFGVIHSSLKTHMLKTRSRWLNCALREDEAVYWVSIGHYEAIADGNW